MVLYDRAGERAFLDLGARFLRFCNCTEIHIPHGDWDGGAEPHGIIVAHPQIPPRDPEREVGDGLESRDQKLGIPLGAQRSEANELRIAFDRGQHLAKAWRVADAIEITGHARKIWRADAHEGREFEAGDRECRRGAFTLGTDQIGGNLGARDLRWMRSAGFHAPLQQRSSAAIWRS